MSIYHMYSDDIMKAMSPSKTDGKERLNPADYVLKLIQNSGGSESKKNQTVDDTLIFLLGETTNVILYSIFRTNQGKEYSRNILREMVDNRKKIATMNCVDTAAKIQAGKLAVDYWIDYFVERGIVQKRNSNPVMFKMVSDQLQDPLLPKEDQWDKPTRDAAAAA